MDNSKKNKINPTTTSDTQVLSKLIDNIPQHIFWKDKNLIFRGCNKMFAAQFGYDNPTSIIGKSDNDFPWSKDLRNKYITDDKNIIKTGKPKLNYVETQRQVDGSDKHVLVSKVPMYDEQGNITGVLGIYTDITEQREREKALQIAKEKAETANKAKTEFLENMRHDIRTPLSGITGFAELIKGEANNPQRIEEYADNLVASGYALTNFLDSVLETIRISNGDSPVAKHKFSLKSLLDDIVHLNQPQITLKQLQLINNVKENLPTYVIGDINRIYRILLELTTNALKFTRKGAITITLEEAKREKQKCIIKMTVNDTGIGIPIDKQDTIFTRFTRLTSTYSNEYEGQGLGLAIVKQFIEELNGEIYVKSQPNQGATFTCLIPFQLPLLDDDSDVVDIASMAQQRNTISLAKQPTNNEDGKSTQGDVRILVVEDNKIAANVISNMLRQLGCGVTIAENGKIACQKATTESFDLIFMDIGLPDMDGYKVTQTIRKHFHNEQQLIPIIALTAHVGIQEKQHCIMAGMNAVLSKPLKHQKAHDMLTAFLPHYAAKQPPAKKQSEPVPSVSGKVIDWEIGKQLVGGKENIAKEMLDMLVAALPEELRKLKDAYKKKDWEQLAFVAHKLRGGACYCPTPRLKTACTQLETLLKTDKENTEKLKTYYQQVVDEILAVQKSTSQ